MAEPSDKERRLGEEALRYLRQSLSEGEIFEFERDECRPFQLSLANICTIQTALVQGQAARERCGCQAGAGEMKIVSDKLTKQLPPRWLQLVFGKGGKDT